MLRPGKKINCRNRSFAFLMIGFLICSIFFSLSLYNLNSIITDYSTNTINPPLDAPLVTQSAGQVDINFAETAGLERINEPVTYTLSDLSIGDAHYDSIRVYDGPIEVTSQTWNMINYANYTFENDADWGDPSGFYIREPSSCVVETLPHYYGWEKVVRLRDDNNVDYFQLVDQTIPNIVAGTVYLMIQVSSTDKEIRMMLGETASKARLEFGEDGHFQVNYDSTWHYLDTDTTYESNTWYLIALEFNCTTDIMTVYINGVQKSQNSFDDTADSIDNLCITSYDKNIHVQTDAECHIAWIDYSFGQGYSEGRYNYLKS